jgi:VanZ family protein
VLEGPGTGHGIGPEPGFYAGTMPTDASLRRPALIVLAAYTVGLAVIGFLPVPVDREVSPWIYAIVKAVHSGGGPAWFTYALIEFTANVALFVPFGVFAVFATGARRWWLALGAGVAASATIELIQWLSLPERIPSALDVLANSLGALLGVCFGYAVLALRIDAGARKPNHHDRLSAARSAPRRSLRGSIRRRATRT